MVKSSHSSTACIASAVPQPQSAHKPAGFDNHFYMVEIMFREKEGLHSQICTEVVNMTWPGCEVRHL